MAEIRLAFFDMDGTLSVPRYLTDEGRYTLGFRPAAWVEFCRVRGIRSYDHCLPVPAVFDYARKLKEQGAELYVLSTVGSPEEIEAKRAFTERVAPGLFTDILGSETNEAKTDVILRYAAERGLAPEECELVEDTYMICLAAMYKGIKATHVSMIFAG